jgi:hypothetical protein
MKFDPARGVLGRGRDSSSRSRVFSCTVGIAQALDGDHWMAEIYFYEVICVYFGSLI